MLETEKTYLLATNELGCLPAGVAALVSCWNRSRRDKGSESLLSGLPDPSCCLQWAHRLRMGTDPRRLWVLLILCGILWSLFYRHWQWAWQKQMGVNRCWLWTYKWHCYLRDNPANPGWAPLKYFTLLVGFFVFFSFKKFLKWIFFFFYQMCTTLPFFPIRIVPLLLLFSSIHFSSF